MERSSAEERPHELDRETLLRVRDRDPRAMNRFFETYYHRVHGYAARLLRDAVLAEDLTQEAFLRMHGALDRLDADRNPTGWVFTIVTNTIRDYWRSRTHRAAARQVSLDEAWELPSRDSRSDPAEALDAKETAEAVRRAMGRLSPADREILLLRTFRELETGEIVEMLGITAEAARQRHSRAVRRLGAAMRQVQGIPPRGSEEEG
jgi:RNA polymerase sigma-70 factor (ECF subfamily)